jgi:hypothetical protein
MLLERRRAQRGFPTLGDEADERLVAALASLPADAAPAAREAGERIGAQVWSRRYHEDGLPGGISILSSALAASGVGALHVEHAFHRSARLRFESAPRLAQAESAVRGAFVAGALAGFLGEAYNCAADARALESDLLQVELGAGRDANRARTGSVA